MSMEEITADCPPRDDLEDILEWVFGDDIGDSEDEDEHDDSNMCTLQLHHIHALRSHYTTNSNYSACV